MDAHWFGSGVDRRGFLKGVASLGGAALIGGCARPVDQAAQAAALSRMPVPGRNRLGIQLYTVRDLTATDYEGTLAQIAQIGYREVEPTGYADYTPQQFRALLDRYGLTAPSTHANLMPGPDLERQLEGYQVMGHRYARSAYPLPAAPAPPAAPGGAAPAGGGPPPPATLDTWQRRAEVLNQVGATARRFGIRPMLHNHTMEFAQIPGTDLRPIDVVLAGTDPENFAWQMDIGWAVVAGVDPVDYFRRYPGRFTTWHLKDIRGLSQMTPQMTMQERQRAAGMAKVGEGEVDWRRLFANAQLAGLEHVFVEVEGEAVEDGSLHAARVSFQYLQRILS
jgi:sugar phosphate isomerase/epimerase